jgi:hypothetical protein
VYGSAESAYPRTPIVKAINERVSMRAETVKPIALTLWTIVTATPIYLRNL